MPYTLVILLHLFTPAVPGEQQSLSPEELESRRKALQKRIFEPAILEASSYRLIFERGTSSFNLQDGRTSIGWHTSLARKGFATVVLREKGRALPVDRVENLEIQAREIRFRGGSTVGDLPEIRFTLRVLSPLVGLEIYFQVVGDGADRVQEVRLLDGAPWIADADGGGVILPRGLGEWLSVARGPDFCRRFRRSDGPLPNRRYPEPASMSALGMVRSGAALIMTWESPGAELEVRRGPVDAPGFPGRAGMDCKFIVPDSSGSVRLYPLGKGDWIEIAHSYRQFIKGRNRSPSLRSKVGGRPDLQGIFGAAILRPSITASPGGALLRSFDSVASLAERWRQVLEIDQALIILDGWSEEEFPGTGEPQLSAASRAGGDGELSSCARRLKKLGYIFGLEVPAGRAWAEALAELKERYSPDLLLVPTRIVEGGALPARNLAREELALGKKIQSTLGLAGTDGVGESWIRSYDYLEGILEHKVSRPAGDLVFPLFTFCYGNSARMAVSPEGAVEPDQPGRLLAHLALGEVPIYALGDPLAKKPGPADRTGDGEMLPGPRWSLARSDGGWAEGKGLTPRECFIKNTFEVLSHVARIRFREPLLYRRFLTEDETVEEVWFGVDLRVVVNYGDREYASTEDDFKLPPGGFWVQYPFFHAFHATRAHGVDYETPALFTVRSLEGKMYLRAEAVRIYHGFGPSQIRLGGRNFDVPREGVVKVW